MSERWVVRDVERGNERAVASKQEAEEIKQNLLELDADEEDIEIVPPGAQSAEATTDGGQAQTVEVVEADADETSLSEHEQQLAERTVSEDPLTWMPGEFVDVIDGSQAINRRGFEVLGHFYDVDVASDLEVAPEETGHEYCRVKATATTADGRECEAYGSAHTDRGDDSYLLLEMADTRARKRALSIATGVGAVAVEELRSEATHD